MTAPTYPLGLGPPRIWKRPGDVFAIDLDFATWPLQAGETLVASNARGALAITATDAAGADASGMLEAPAIVGTAVRWIVKGGAAGQTISITVTAPTSDGELLTDSITLRVV